MNKKTLNYILWEFNKKLMEKTKYERVAWKKLEWFLSPWTLPLIEILRLFYAKSIARRSATTDSFINVLWLATKNRFFAIQLNFDF